MKKTVIAGAIASLMTAPIMAQNVGTNDELIQKVERLEAEVDYLKENAKADRKDGAAKSVVLEGLTTTAAKFVWSGDFRYRHEDIETEGNAGHRERDRIRVRFGALIKVADNINTKLQISTTNNGADNARSTNQTMGNSAAGNAAWDRKPVSFDQAYVEWKPDMFATVQLGKTPIPWATTASYFWDKDLTPEGGAVKYVNGPFFATATYDLLSEQNSGSSLLKSTDSKMASAQIGWKQLLAPTTTLTAAVGYFNLKSVGGQPIAYNKAVDQSCTADASLNSAFSSDGGLGNSVGKGSWNGVAGTCVLLSDFKLIEAQAQLDFIAGAYPVSTFVDYIKNKGANDSIDINNVNNGKLDTAYAVGFTFNKASAAKSWEAGVVYQKTEKDSVYAQFHDSDFGGGITDTSGYALKAAYVPVVGWTMNATYFINKRFNDGAAKNDTTPYAGAITTAKTSHDYKRLQLDMNYKF